MPFLKIIFQKGNAFGFAGSPDFRSRFLSRSAAASDPRVWFCLSGPGYWLLLPGPGLRAASVLLLVVCCHWSWSGVLTAYVCRAVPCAVLLCVTIPVLVPARCVRCVCS